MWIAEIPRIPREFWEYCGNESDICRVPAAIDFTTAFLRILNRKKKPRRRQDSNDRGAFIVDSLDLFFIARKKTKT